ncbi:MAG TPA: hypothetical protein VGL02_22300 [Streptomyces sp.]
MTEDPRISEIRAVLDESWEFDDFTDFMTDQLTRIRAILDRPAPTPRVFFPGGTVPNGVCIVSKSGLDSGAHFTTDGEWTIPSGLSPYVEVLMPTVEEWKAAVDQARDARADAEWQHTEGTNP